jgi:hypothetical protein
MKRVLIVSVIAGLLVAGALAAKKSGLAVGEKLEAFLVKNCDGGDPYCQVCKYGKRPKLITVGDLEDPAWIQDLMAIQQIHERYSQDGKGLAVFALAAVIRDGKAVPVADAASALARLKEIEEKNQITFPLVIAQNADEVYKAQNKSNPGYKIFEDYYEVTASRTVMFGDGGNTVKFNAILADDTRGEQLAELELVVRKSL